MLTCTSRAHGAESEIRSTAVFALGEDPSGQKPAAMAAALLQEHVRAARTLRLVDPGRVLSGDPRTREEETLERARAALADGRRAYDNLALDDAIARLGQAVSLYQQTGPLLGDLNELHSALEYLAASLVLRGSSDEAESTFLELLTVRPNHRLLDFPPSVERVFDSAAARLDATPAGSVEIYSTPPYAAVYLDGRFEGVTPLVLEDVVAGTHYLRLDRLGYTIHGAPLQIAPKQTITSQTRLSSLVRGAELRDLAARSIEEVSGSGMGGQTRELARTVRADMLIFVIAHQSGRDATFTGAVYDARTSQRIATEQVVLSSDRGLTERLGRYLRRLVRTAETGEAEKGDGPEAARVGAEDSEIPPRTAFGLAPDSGQANPSSSGFSAAPPADARVVAETSASQTPGEVYLGWTLVGVGGAALATGVVFGILAQNAHDEFRDTAQLSEDLSDVRDRGRTFSTAADALYIGGGALLAGGAALVLLSDLLASGSGFQAGVVPAPGGGLVRVGAEF